MPPSKRKTKSHTLSDDAQQPPPPTKRLTKPEREKLIVKAKLDSLEQEESLIKDDRLSAEEKKRLLDAYNDHGFHVFHNQELLIQYIPNRRAQDITGFIHRMQTTLQMQNFDRQSKSDQPECSKLDEWERLSNQLTRNFAKGSKNHLGDVFTDALMQLADEFKQTSTTPPEDGGPNYSELLENFAQLMAGKFPERTSPINGQISRQIFDHINSIVDSIDLRPIVELIEHGKWMESDRDERLKAQEMALEGLQQSKGQLSFNGFEKSKHIETLCLELPKIKRLTEMLNPLRVNKNLMESANKLETFVDDK